MKVGLIRCLQTEDVCPAKGCFNAAMNKTAAFENLKDVEIIAVNTCGGCPGKKAAFRAENMVKFGCDTIAFASCISKGAPIGFPCPHFEQMKEAVKKKVGDDITILDFTH